MHIQRDDLIDLYKSPKTIAIVGLSDKPERYSYQVASYLKSLGHHIIPVNPNIDSVFGEKSFPSLLDIPIKVDVVDIFRRSEFVPDIVDSAIKIGADWIWMQEGVSSPQAAAKAREHGIKVVQDMCMKKTHEALSS